MGLPKKSFMFLRGMRLLPPRAGMMQRFFVLRSWLFFFLIHRLTPLSRSIIYIEFFYLTDHKGLIFICQGREHGQADAFAVVGFRMWHIAGFPAKLLIVRHQVHGDVVDLSKDFVLAEVVIEF